MSFKSEALKLLAFVTLGAGIVTGCAEKNEERQVVEQSAEARAREREFFNKKYTADSAAEKIARAVDWNLQRAENRRDSLEVFKAAREQCGCIVVMRRGISPASFEEYKEVFVVLDKNGVTGYGSAGARYTNPDLQ